MAENGAIKDRIKSLRRVNVSELQVHPKNFRKHAQGQRRAMSAALHEIGFADALLVRETPDGLQIIDGHLRADLAKDQKVPVLVLDVNEQEADKLLATFDAITGLAEIDEELLRSLTDGLEFETPELDELVADREGVEGHPTPKPVKVWSWLVERVTPDVSSLVLDPFLGSGTTLIAAEQLGRTCYGIEIEPRYVDVILRRYMNFTDLSPVRERDGALFSELVKGELAHA